MKYQKQRVFKNLIVWQKSMKLVTNIYRLTEKFPQKETYGLTSQIRRCAISIPSNISEGSMRSSKKDFVRFLYMSYGSGAELQTQLEIANNLEYIKEKSFVEISKQLNEIMKILNVFIAKIKTDY
ncbi:four helix bundle protein [Candidatus Pacebacteria bacterium]|nr:four helix bundle protein [Candidatus Paceibacterota bacterium]